MGDRRQRDRQVDAREEAAAVAVRGAVLRTHDATEASIRQVLGKQTLPVFFDELEAEANSDRAMRVIKLARLASSAGVIYRGGSDHQATEFIARSCFYFTSILMPAMLAQDRNRLAILELGRSPRARASRSSSGA
jgi:hypothetical protein